MQPKLVDCLDLCGLSCLLIDPLLDLAILCDFDLHVHNNVCAPAMLEVEYFTN